MRVLRALVASHDERRLSELARELGMPKSTVLVTLTALAEMGYVDVTRSGGYRLGFEFYKMAVTGLSRYQFRDAVMRFLEEAVQATRETVYWCLYHNDEILFMDRKDGPHAVAYHPRLTESYSLHAGAGGKAVLAFLDGEERERYLSRTLPRVTAHTITDPDRLRRDLEETRRRGYAVSVGERVEGAAAVAAPVFGTGGRVVGSLVISMPVERFREHDTARLGEVARRTADRISAAYQAHQPMEV